MKHLVFALLLISFSGIAQNVIEIASDRSVATNDQVIVQEDEVNDTNSVFIAGTFQNVLDRAKNENKNVLLHFGAVWCLPCRQMKKTTYTNSIVKTKMDEAYLAYEVDVDFFWGMDIAEEFGVTKYPTVIVLDTEGKKTSMHEGYLGPREMYRLLRNY